MSVVSFNITNTILDSGGTAGRAGVDDVDGDAGDGVVTVVTELGNNGVAVVDSGTKSVGAVELGDSGVVDPVDGSVLEEVGTAVGVEESTDGSGVASVVDRVNRVTEFGKRAEDLSSLSVVENSVFCRKSNKSSVSAPGTPSK